VPNKASAAKRMRQNAKRRLRNRAIKSAMKTSLKKAASVIAEGQEGKAEPAVLKAAVVSAQKEIARAAKKGSIHHRKAARLTSRLMKRAAKSAAAKA